MKRVFKDLIGFVAAIIAIGAAAILWTAITQLIAVGIAVLVGVLVALTKDWVTGVIAAIFAYAIVMKAFHYLDIFDMISSGTKNRDKTNANKGAAPNGDPVTPMQNPKASGEPPSLS